MPLMKLTFFQGYRHQQQHLGPAGVRQDPGHAGRSSGWRHDRLSATLGGCHGLRKGCLWLLGERVKYSQLILVA